MLGLIRLVLLSVMMTPVPTLVNKPPTMVTVVSSTVEELRSDRAQGVGERAVDQLQVAAVAGLDDVVVDEGGVRIDLHGLTGHVGIDVPKLTQFIWFTQSWPEPAMVLLLVRNSVESQRRRCDR